MEDIRLFTMCLENYFSTRKNKRYGRDQMEFETNWAARLMRFCRSIKYKTLRIEENYAFLVSRPKWREIFATCFEGRMADHLLCDTLLPYIEVELSPRTFNNRKGLGSKAAINQVIDDIYSVSEGYTKPVRIIKWDISGFFPSARWDIMQKCFDDIIDKNRESIIDVYGEDMVDMLHWLAMLCVNSSPADHCELRSPSYLWRDHIERSKSMFCRKQGCCAPIGRLSSQHAMGMYINDIVIWLNDYCMVSTAVFVDDGTMVVDEDNHHHVLYIMNELRDRLAEKGLKLNEKKFYDQPYQNGLELLGRHIKPYRVHLNNKTYSGAMERVNEFNHIGEWNKASRVDEVISSLNSYGGLLKGGTDYERLLKMRDSLCESWWKYLEWNEQKLCLNIREEYSFRERMNRKYGLKLKQRRAA